MITSSYSLSREAARCSRLGEYELVITEPDATNCFSINFLVNIMVNFLVNIITLFALYTVVYIMA